MSRLPDQPLDQFLFFLCSVDIGGVANLTFISV